MAILFPEMNCTRWLVASFGRVERFVRFRDQAIFRNRGLVEIEELGHIGLVHFRHDTQEQPDRANEDEIGAGSVSIRRLDERRTRPVDDGKTEGRGCEVKV